MLKSTTETARKAKTKKPTNPPKKVAKKATKKAAKKSTGESVSDDHPTGPISFKPPAPEVANYLAYYQAQSLSKRSYSALKVMLLQYDESFYTVPHQSEILLPPSRSRDLKSRHDLVSATLPLTKFVAIDCEFVGVAKNGKRDVSELARVSLVNKYGVVLYDAYVQPRWPVVNWRQKYSGITRGVMKRARDRGEIVTFPKAQGDIAALIQGRYLIGHAISNDLSALDLSHPHVIDTQKLPRIAARPGLKRNLSELYGLSIQDEKIQGHSSVEDARASLLLFRTFYDEYVEVYPTLSTQTEPDVPDISLLVIGDENNRVKEPRLELGTLSESPIVTELESPTPTTNDQKPKRKKNRRSRQPRRPKRKNGESGGQDLK